jgi:hypothetical protein
MAESENLVEKPDARSEESASSGKRIVDHLDPRLVNILTALGFVIPVAGYFWYLVRFSVNAMRGDQWVEVVVVKQSYVHFFPWGAMWAQENENRIFFQNVIVILLAHVAHFNIQIEEYLGAVMLAAATMCILWAHKRRSPSTPWLYYCPVPILTFSVVQEGNTLWGFQVGWYLIFLCLAAAILLLDRVTLTWVTLLGALAAAVVGSFSSLQGLLIWPIGLVLLYFRRRSLPYIGAWIAAAIASSILYFHNYNFTRTPDRHFASQHPLVALKFFLLAIGDVVGQPITNGSESVGETMVMLFGILIVLLAVATVVICGVRRDERGSSPVGIAFICYGLLFAAIITQGRIEFGYAAAGFSRYTTYDLLILLGIYLALLGRRSQRGHIATASAELQLSDSGWKYVRGSGGWLDRVGLSCALVVVLAAVLVQIPLGLYNGVQEARSDYTADIAAANVLRNINKSSDAEVNFNLDLFFKASWLRAQARTLEEHGLSVFANG